MSLQHVWFVFPVGYNFCNVWSLFIFWLVSVLTIIDILILKLIFLIINYYHPSERLLD